ncbi:MAG: beta strand repeat-containing protein, partial [Gaiellaceae bacterium]
EVSSTENPEADASTHGTSAGAGAFGSSDSYVVDSPIVRAYFASSSTASAGGIVSVEATLIPAAGTTPPSYVINSVDANNNSLDVTDNGLNTGDVVSYSNGGGSDIGGAPSQTSETTPDGSTVFVNRDYNVVDFIRSGGNTVVDPSNFSLGAAFDGGACPGTTQSCVDGSNDTITFSQPHNFVTGDAVQYVPGVGSTLVGGLNTSSTYYVVVVDDRTIRLVLNQNQITDPTAFYQQFLPSGVSGSAITTAITGSGFTDNGYYTYHAPTATSLTNAAVDINGGDSTGATADTTDDPGGDNIVFIDPDTGNLVDSPFRSGDRILYQVSPGGTAIGGLTSGTIYRVVYDSNHPNQIQLKFNDTNTNVNVDFVDSGSGDQIIRNDGQTWAANGFGAGQTLTISGSPFGTDNAKFEIASVDGSTLTLCGSTCTAGTTAAADYLIETLVNGANLTLTRGADSSTNDTITWTNAPTNGFAQTNFSTSVASGQIVVDGTTYTVTGISGSVLTLSTKQGITSTTLTGVQMHQAAVTASFDEAVIALSPAKSAINANLSVTNGDEITRTDGRTWVDAGFAAGSDISLRGTTNDDGSYEVSSISGSTISLCASNCDASVTAAGSLLNDSASPGTVALIATGHDPGSDTHSFIDVLNLPLAVMNGSTPVGVLKDGATYRVVNVTSIDSTHQSFQLEDTDGNLLTLGTTVNDALAGLGLAARVSSNTLQLTGTSNLSPTVHLASASGQQALVLKLSGSLTSGDTYQLEGPGGVSLGTSLNHTGTGTSTAYSTGSSGGIIAATGNSANVTADATVKAYVLSTLITAGGDVSIESLSASRTNAH